MAGLTMPEAAERAQVGSNLRQGCGEDRPRYAADPRRLLRDHRRQHRVPGRRWVVRPALKFALTELTVLWDFFCDIENHTLYVAAPANPARLAGDIKPPER